MLLSDFPPAPPGAGLLLLRAVLATFLVTEGAGNVLDATGADILGIVYGVALVLLGIVVGLGFFTPVVHSIVAIIKAVLAAISLHSVPVLVDAVWQVPFLQGAIALAIALVGPGAYSVDSRLFGRREITIRRADHDEDAA